MHVHYMRAHRTLSFAAREAHAKRARSRCAAASTGQAPTPCTRTRQIQRGHSFPWEIHTPWLHVPPMECMGSMKRDSAFWTCHTRTPRSSGRVTAAVGGPQDAPSGPKYARKACNANKAAIGPQRSISRIKHDLHRKNAQSAHSPAKPACGSRAQRLPRRAHVPRTGCTGYTRLGTRPSVRRGRYPE